MLSSAILMFCSLSTKLTPKEGLNLKWFFYGLSLWSRLGKDPC